MKILITGGAGFIGSHLVDKLLNLNHDVVVVDNLLRGNKLSNPSNVNLNECDVNDFDQILKLSKGCELIFHLAAFLGVDQVAENPVITMETETIGTFNIVKAAIKNNIPKIVYASTSGVYGKMDIDSAVNENFSVSPSSSYAIAKRYNEIYLKSIYKKYQINTYSLRFFNIYGPRQDNRMVVPRFFENAINNKDIIVFGDGKQTRDFTYIDDTIDATFKISELNIGSEIINIAYGKDVTMLDLATRIKKITNSKSNIKLIPNPVFRNDYEVERRFGNSAKLAELTGFKPNTNLDKGLLKTFENIKSIK
ncbi:NAD-dependent epimerase/dehydratase family protein [Pelagibacteraceae bacterium]|nr:NAD-dependent epimerase/dehydratase family protein [Pelagibacteraceae bacterium]|tara:strand:- start:33 stop:956 length:924 start_codon:yes stop_codon:yes gene_type:complete